MKLSKLFEVYDQRERHPEEGETPFESWLQVVWEDPKRYGFDIWETYKPIIQDDIAEKYVEIYQNQKQQIMQLVYQILKSDTRSSLQKELWNNIDVFDEDDFELEDINDDYNFLNAIRAIAIDYTTNNYEIKISDKWPENAKEILSQVENGINNVFDNEGVGEQYFNQW